VPYWGWGFSLGKQFKEGKFDYCVLLAAHKNEAFSKLIFVLKLQEMNKIMEPRVSGGSGKNMKSYFIETSDGKDFFTKKYNF